MTQLWYIGVLCVLISSSVRGQENKECFGETLNDQAVDLTSGASLEGPISDISDPETCLLACCNKEDCHLALVGRPQDGQTQCFFVSCMKDGENVCHLQSKKDFTVYRNKTTSTEAEGKAAVSTDVCAAPMVVGFCRAALPRFYYNGTSCQKFDYGGCGGNENNFETIEACNATCKGTSGAVNLPQPSAPASRKRMAPAEHDAGTPDVSLREMTAEDFAERCLAEAKTGLCRASIQRFFFNGTAATCQSFIYGGCGGNDNNYGSIEECKANCLVTVIPSPRKAPEGTSAPPADCTAKFETGPCRAAFPSFYYDPSTQSCLPFIYGGCGGNDNRFSSEEDCVIRCSGQEGTTGKHGTRSNRTPAYVMVGTLVVFSAVSLAGLLLVMLRKSKFHRRRRDDKEELLPEDQLTTEQSA